MQPGQDSILHPGKLLCSTCACAGVTLTAVTSESIPISPGALAFCLPGSIRRCLHGRWHSHSKEMETLRIFCLPLWHFYPSTVPYGLHRVAPTSGFSSHCAAGGSEQAVLGWERGVQLHGLSCTWGSRRAGTCHPFPWVLIWALSPSVSWETWFTEDLMLLDYPQSLAVPEHLGMGIGTGNFSRCQSLEQTCSDHLILPRGA